MSRIAQGILRELSQRGIRAMFTETKDQARTTVLEMIPPGATVMTGSSLTLDETGIIASLQNGHYRYIREEIRAIDDPQLRNEKRRHSLLADYFLGGINALAATGEIVNIDSSGSRIAGYAYGGKRVIMVAGLNKIVPSLAEAIDRIRVVAAIQEARRLGRTPPCIHDGICRNYECYPPERQCGKILIIEKENVPDRITVVLVGEPLGY